MCLDRDPQTGTRTGMRTGRRTGRRTMPEARHQPPSRRRYAATHPTIGVHCDRETYDALMALRERSGLSFGQLVRQALGALEMDIETVEDVATVVGYEQAAAQYRLRAPCSICGKPMDILAGSGMAAEAIRALRTWGHVPCIRGGASRS